MISSLRSPRVSIYNMLDIQLEIKFLDLPVIEHWQPTSAPGGGGCYYLETLQGFLSECGETASGQTVNNAITEPMEGTRAPRGADQPVKSHQPAQPARHSLHGLKRGTEEMSWVSKIFGFDKPESFCLGPNFVLLL